MSVYMNYPPTWRPMDFAMHYGIGVNRLNKLSQRNNRSGDAYTVNPSNAEATFVQSTRM